MEDTTQSLTPKQRKMLSEKAKIVTEIQDLKKRVAQVNQRLIDEGLEYFVTKMPNCW